MYVFGGSTGGALDDLHRLNLIDFSWSEVVSTCVKEGVGSNNNYYLDYDRELTVNTNTNTNTNMAVNNNTNNNTNINGNMNGNGNIFNNNLDLNTDEFNNNINRINM